MAILQGVGYPAPNLSHFRSIEIWDTASDSRQVLQTGWLTRTADRQSAFAAASADGVVIGAADLGPFAGGARAVALNDPARFARQARLASAEAAPARGALAHVLRVESDVVRAGADIRPDVSFKTEFPRGAFGLAVQHAAGIAASGKVPVLRLTLSGFDTHQNQLGIHANLLRIVAESVVALRAALSEHGIWDRTLILTYSEFGRRPAKIRAAAQTTEPRARCSRLGPRCAAVCMAMCRRYVSSTTTATPGTRLIFDVSMRRYSNTGGNCRRNECCNGASSR